MCEKCIKVDESVLESVKSVLEGVIFVFFLFLMKILWVSVSKTVLTLLKTSVFDKT